MLISAMIILASSTNHCTLKKALKFLKCNVSIDLRSPSDRQLFGVAISMSFMWVALSNPSVVEMQIPKVFV